MEDNINLQKSEETTKKVNENEQFLSDFSEMAKQEIHTDSHKKRVKGLRGKKRLMVETLIAKLGIVSDACKAVGISRRTHYKWLDEDEKYRNAVKEAEEVVKDLAEKVLYSSMFIDKDIQSIRFFLERKAKDRGYGLHQDLKVEHKVSNLSIEEFKRMYKDFLNDDKSNNQGTDI